MKGLPPPNMIRRPVRATCSRVLCHQMLRAPVPRGCSAEAAQSHCFSGVHIEVPPSATIDPCALVQIAQQSRAALKGWFVFVHCGSELPMLSIEGTSTLVDRRMGSSLPGLLACRGSLGVQPNLKTISVQYEAVCRHATCCFHS